jgi:hypothetical protein
MIGQIDLHHRPKSGDRIRHRGGCRWGESDGALGSAVFQRLGRASAGWWRVAMTIDRAAAAKRLIQAYTAKVFGALARLITPDRDFAHFNRAFAEILQRVRFENARILIE